MRRVSLLGVGVVMLLAGGAGHRVPDWLYGESPQYPRQAFLTGVGSAAERSLAEDRARLEIAKVFHVDLQARETATETAQLSAGREAYAQEVRSELTARSGRILQGVSIAGTWRDAESGSWHALAVLDRMRMARSLEEVLSGLDSRLAEQLRQADLAGSPLRSLAACLRARELAVQRQGVAGDLAVVRQGVAGDLAVVRGAGTVSPPLSLGELEARIDRLAAAQRFALVLDNDRGDIVAGGVVSAFAALGIRLAPTVESTLLLRGRVEVVESPPRDGLAWRVATGQLELVEPGGGIVDSLRLSVREGSNDPASADALARELLGRQLGRALAEKLRGLGRTAQ